jgi:precorrin-6A/cobalt-precorrin-6A reductase
MKRSILILGGTADARILAGKLAEDTDYTLLLSLAGRTRDPVAQPVPVRTGGFGGAEGLATFLKQNHIDTLIDATHPYAARISANAVKAAAIAEVPLIALRRPAWKAQSGDSWHTVESVGDAVTALGEKPQTVFLALGRQELLPFEAAPQHNYVIRSVDPVEPPLDVPSARYFTARGPFVEDDERQMLVQNAIGIIVCKNSGGTASYGKIAAARALGIPVIIIDRPDLPAAPDLPPANEAVTVTEVIDKLRAHPAFPEERGE